MTHGNHVIDVRPLIVRKLLDLCTRQRDDTVCFIVREYRLAVSKDQMPRIFELFYRHEGELTR